MNTYIGLKFDIDKVGCHVVNKVGDVVGSLDHILDDAHKADLQNNSNSRI